MVDPVKPHVEPMWGKGATTSTPVVPSVASTATNEIKTVADLVAWTDKVAAAPPVPVPIPQSPTPPTTTTVATVTTTTTPASSTVLWYQSQRFVILCQSSALLVLAWLGTALATNDWAWRVIAISVLGNVALQLKDWWSPTVIAPFAALNKNNVGT